MQTIRLLFLIALAVPKSALAASDLLLLEARHVDRLAAVGIAFAADGSLFDAAADPALVAGAFARGDTLVVVPGAGAQALRTVAFDRPALLAGSAARSTPVATGVLVRVAPGSSGAALLPEGSPEAALSAAGAWTAFAPNPDRLFDVQRADVDLDGFADTADAFPLDPAASLDSDGDGYPDSWNPGKGRADSTTGLVLDAFPNDPNRFGPGDARPVPALPLPFGAGLALALLYLAVRMARPSPHRCGTVALLRS